MATLLSLSTVYGSQARTIHSADKSFLGDRITSSFLQFHQIWIKAALHLLNF